MDAFDLGDVGPVQPSLVFLIQKVLVPVALWV